MPFDLPGWSQFILAIVAVAGAIGAHRLNRRGQVTQEKQQAAANQLAERAQNFDQMERLAEARQEEINRVNRARDEERARHERDEASLARRCRTTLDHFMLAFTNLQGAVVAENVRQAAEAAHIEIEQHLTEDHPPPLDDD